MGKVVESCHEADFHINYQIFYFKQFINCFFFYGYYKKESPLNRHSEEERRSNLLLHKDKITLLAKYHSITGDCRAPLRFARNDV